jgi:hypothetical protein
MMEQKHCTWLVVGGFGEGRSAIEPTAQGTNFVD